MLELSMVSFVFACPNGHRPTFIYDPGELRRDLDKTAFRLFCVGCAAYYSPTDGEKSEIRKRLEEFESPIDWRDETQH
jgi:hypothetical protein